MLQRLQRKWSKIKWFATIQYPMLLFAVLFSFATIPFSVTLLSEFVNDKVKDIFLIFFVALIIASLLIAPLAIGRFIRLNNLALQLFAPDRAKRRQAFEQLLQKGDEAVKIFARVLNEVPYDFPEAICLAAEGLGRLKAAWEG